MRPAYGSLHYRARIMNRINKEDWIYFIKWSVLPVFNLRKNLICNIRNKSLWSFKAVSIFNVFWNLSCGHSFCIHGNDFLIDIRNLFLTFLYNLRFKSRFPILRNFDLHTSKSAVDSFGLIAISSIIIVWMFRFFISEMIIHFSFHHFFDCSTEKIFQNLLDILCCLNVVFLQKLMDNVTYPFCHSYFVYRFLLSYRKKRPSYDFYFIIEEPSKFQFKEKVSHSR